MIIENDIDLNVGDELKLFYSHSFLNSKGSSIRVFKDTQGRNFNTYPRSNTNYKDLKLNQEVVHFVSKIAENGYPKLIEKINFDFRFGEFKEGDHVILNFVEDSVNVRGVSVRTVKDKSGREFTHNLEYPTQFPEPEKDQEIKYFVKEISPQFKPKFWELKKARYEIGDYLDLEVVEDKKIIKKINGTQTMFRILRDKNYPDELLHIPLLPFQSGEKYISPEEGKIIRYEVIDLFPDNTIKFKELNSTNPYFISLESFTKNTQEIFKVS